MHMQATVISYATGAYGVNFEQPETGLSVIIPCKTYEHARAVAEAYRAPFEAAAARGMAAFNKGALQVSSIDAIVGGRIVCRNTKAR